MPENKKQHFIPQCYLKQFADENSLTNVLLIKDNLTKIKVPYKSQCYSDYYYGENLQWEKNWEP